MVVNPVMVKNFASLLNWVNNFASLLNLQTESQELEIRPEMHVKMASIDYLISRSQIDYPIRRALTRLIG